MHQWMSGIPQLSSGAEDKGLIIWSLTHIKHDITPLISIEMLLI